MKDIAVYFDTDGQQDEFEGRLNSLWETWAGRGPPADPNAPKKSAAPYEGRGKKQFYEQDFIRFDVDRLTPQI
eukprot:7182544-Alexandrium_andersonii.AAC.1